MFQTLAIASRYKTPNISIFSATRGSTTAVSTQYRNATHGQTDIMLYCIYRIHIAQRWLKSCRLRGFELGLDWIEQCFTSPPTQ